MKDKVVFVWHVLRDAEGTKSYELTRLGGQRILLVYPNSGRYAIVCANIYIKDSWPEGVYDTHFNLLTFPDLASAIKRVEKYLGNHANRYGAKEAVFYEWELEDVTN